MSPHTPHFQALKDVSSPGIKTFKNLLDSIPSKEATIRDQLRPGLWESLTCPACLCKYFQRQKPQQGSWGRKKGGGSKEYQSKLDLWAPCADESQAHTIGEDSRMLAYPWQEPPHLHQSASSMFRG